VNVANRNGPAFWHVGIVFGALSSLSFGLPTPSHTGNMEKRSLWESPW
jgi:hypothetical protein